MEEHAQVLFWARRVPPRYLQFSRSVTLVLELECYHFRTPFGEPVGYQHNYKSPAFLLLRKRWTMCRICVHRQCDKSLNFDLSAGLVGCFVMCIILAAAEAFTLYVLSKMAERYQGKTYGLLVRKALGRKLSSGQ